MSSFTMFNIACSTRFAFAASSSCSIAPKTRGTTCRDRANLSVTQPQRFGSPPSHSLPHGSSTSSCVSQVSVAVLVSRLPGACRPG
jgi:hypothetical protein